MLPFVPGIVPGTNRVCPRDKPGEIGLPLCRIRRIPGFVPVFHRICPRDKLALSLGQIRWKLGLTGQKSLCLCAFFLPEFGGRTFRPATKARGSFGENFGANFGANFGGNFGNFVSNFATIFGNFVQQKGGAKNLLFAANHRDLDGPAVRNANRGDSHESIRANRFAEKKPIYITSSESHESPQTCDSQFFSPPKRDSQEGGSVREPCMKRFARIQARRANLGRTLKST